MDGKVISDTVCLGELPVGCTVLGIRPYLVGERRYIVIATDQGVFMAEPGRSNLTKLEPMHEPF